MAEQSCGGYSKARTGTQDNQSTSPEVAALRQTAHWGYPANRDEVASTIRKADRFECVQCGAVGSELHVHHIVYVSNFGTHAKENLVSLCRTCHEEEHERTFDFGEGEPTSPIPPMNGG